MIIPKYQECQNKVNIWIFSCCLQNDGYLCFAVCGIGSKTLIERSSWSLSAVIVSNSRKLRLLRKGGWHRPLIGPWSEWRLLIGHQDGLIIRVIAAVVAPDPRDPPDGGRWLSWVCQLLEPATSATRTQTPAPGRWQVILSSDWSMQITWPEYWALIGLQAPGRWQHEPGSLIPPLPSHSVVINMK